MPEEIKSKIKRYKYHPLAEVLPLMEGDEFESFVADIDKHGLLDEIVLFEDKILDGRNRDRACIKLKIPGIYKNLPEGISALDYIVSENLHRRHLNLAQRSEFALFIEIEEAKKIKKEESLRKKGLSPKKESPRHASKIAANKALIGATTLRKTKKIKEIAENKPIIKKEWNKALKGKTSVDAVYKKALIIDDIAELPTPQRHKIEEILIKETKSIKQIKQDVQDLKDNKTRAEIAKRSIESEKQKEEREKLHLKITELTKNIHELENDFKSSIIKLEVISKEAVESFPHIKSNDPAYVSTHLNIYYDTLDMKIYDTELINLKIKYDKLEKPLRDKLAILEGEYKAQKDTIDKQKTNKNKEVSQIEKYQDLMAGEFDKQDLYKENIEKLKKELKILQEKYND